MATVENVVIKITTTASTRQVRNARNELLSLAKAGKLNGTTAVDLQKQFDKFDKRLKMMKGAVSGVTGALISLNKVSLKLFTVGFAIGSAALAANNALLAVGRFAVNAYKVAMQGLAVVVAAVGAGLATAAAAFNEYTAAVNAYAFKSSPALKNRLGESSAGLRNLQSDATLATFGVQALAGAFAAISKNAQVTGTSKTLLKGLADFAAAGGDPAKNLAAAGEFIGLLQKSGKLDSKAIAAAQGLGPTFVDALKKAQSQGVSTLDEFAKMLSSGQLAALGGVEGQAGIVGGTLMGQFRAFTVEMLKMATDFGQVLLGPVKSALATIGKIIQKTIMRIGPEMVKFGQGPVLKALVRMFEMLDNFAINLFRKHLPGANGMMARFVDFWNKSVYFVKDVIKRLQSLLPGGKAVIEAFGKPFMEIFKTVGIWIRYIGDTIRGNQEKFNAFGQAFLNLVLKIQEIGKVFIDNFTEALPFLTRILDWATSLFDSIMRLVDAIGVLGSALEFIVNLLGGVSDGIGGMTKLIGVFALASFMRYKVGNMLGMPQKGLMYMAGQGVSQGGQRGQGVVQRAIQRRQNQKAQQALGPVYGPPAPPGTGRRRIMRNANTRADKFLRGYGTAALLGVGSMFAAPEAQGSMMTGSAIASLAPFLGAAGPYAAFAGLGIAGYGMMKNSRTAKGGALGGAMTGAALGGAIGTAIPGIGTATGMIVGAIAGTVVGYVKGRANAEKLKVEKAVGAYMDKQMVGIGRGLVTGDTAGVRRQLAALSDRAKYINEINETMFQGTQHGRVTRQATATALYESGKITQEERDALIAAPGTYAKALQEQSDLVNNVATPMLKKYDQAALLASKSLGLTSEELNNLAMQTGVNLYDTSVSLRDKFVALGLAMNYTSEQIVGAMRDIQINGVERFMSRIEQVMSPKRIDEIAEGLYKDFISGAEIGMDDLGKFITDFLNQLNIMNPDSPLTNVATLLKMLGPDGALFRAGSQLEGMQDVFAPVQQMLKGLGEQTRVDAAASLTDMIVKQGLFGGVAFNREEVAGRLGNMSIEQLQALQYRLQDPNLSPVEVGMLMGYSQPTSRYGYEGSRQGISERLGTVGLGGVSFEKLDTATMTMDQLITLYGEEGAAVMTGINKLIESTFQNKPDWMKNAPDWYTAESFKALIEAAGADTSTPRGSGDTTSSRLGRTLRRHSFFDSMFTGSRNITSAYRTTNLGSINSDHITGRAYDLTGDNLGAYANMVNKFGGFAEFHGRGGSRHLHVVPGETPVGDSTAPSMGPVAMPSSNSSTTNYYNISVQPTPGMDVNQLADAVMNRIQRVERSSRERS